MSKQLKVSVSLKIKAGKEDVWDALTNPHKIKHYLFGTNAISDWKKGSSLKFTGEWEGKTYEDKGTILDTVPGKLFRYTYWSSMGKLEDKPENYATVTYELVPAGDETMLIVTQDQVATPEAKEHSEQNWKYVLDELKKLVES
ncbi:MAG: SRPBCC domain-containing protein [Bacteroidetes bacterium]|nr:SRPBCC domain-containing protein [Bacteroidota bacterium]